MAGINPPLLALVLAIALCLHQPSAKGPEVGDDLIGKTCNHTKYYNLCVNILVADNRSSANEVSVFADIVVQLEMSRMAEAYQYVDKILKNITDVGMKQLLYYCQLDYDEDIRTLDQVHLDIKNKMYIDANLKLESVLGDGADCEGIFKKSKPVRKSPLTRRNERIDQISSIAQDIINLLI